MKCIYRYQRCSVYIGTKDAVFVCLLGGDGCIKLNITSSSNKAPGLCV